ncbi:hypothetical protein [Candidatus Liberibacter sp.]|uniref:hypothetical protein n=1 Tax=Candidatus Liberibacter sp. TaxID=34022 RepID=UPI0015F66F84|nr:hypothetical protein [Candidatus Liberibacter sp.]MBA5724088.1 hypothetical protein [Candidatus Liberibacter sp.]
MSQAVVRDAQDFVDFAPIGDNSQRFLKDKRISGDVFSGKEKDDFISSNNDQSVKDFYRVMMMVETYRSRGHFNARLDP